MSVVHVGPFTSVPSLPFPLESMATVPVDSLRLYCVPSDKIILFDVPAVKSICPALTLGVDVPWLDTTVSVPARWAASMRWVVPLKVRQ